MTNHFFSFSLASILTRISPPSHLTTSRVLLTSILLGEWPACSIKREGGGRSIFISRIVSESSRASAAISWTRPLAAEPGHDGGDVCSGSATPELNLWLLATPSLAASRSKGEAQLLNSAHFHLGSACIWPDVDRGQGAASQ